MAGYSAHSADIHSKKVSKTEESDTKSDKTVVKAISFEATTAFSQVSLHRFSVVLFSFEYVFKAIIPDTLLFPTFVNIIKQILFGRISPTNAP